MSTAEYMYDVHVNGQSSIRSVGKSGEYWDLSRVPHLLTHTLSLQKFKQKKDDCPARLSAAAAEQEEISSPPDLSVTRRFDFAEPALSAAECHAPAFPAATGHDRATRELSSTQQHNNISSGPKQI